MQWSLLRRLSSSLYKVIVTWHGRCGEVCRGNVWSGVCRHVGKDVELRADTTYAERCQEALKAWMSSEVHGSVSGCVWIDWLVWRCRKKKRVRYVTQM